MVDMAIPEFLKTKADLGRARDPAARGMDTKRTLRV
jgi:hypothetical protein